MTDAFAMLVRLTATKNVAMLRRERQTAESGLFDDAPRQSLALEVEQGDREQRAHPAPVEADREPAELDLADDDGTEALDEYRQRRAAHRDLRPRRSPRSERDRRWHRVRLGRPLEGPYNVLSRMTTSSSSVTQTRTTRSIASAACIVMVAWLVRTEERAGARPACRSHR